MSQRSTPDNEATPLESEEAQSNASGDAPHRHDDSESDNDSSMSTSATGSEEEEEEAGRAGFASFDEALQARQEALQLYNKGAYDAAMRLQYRLVRYVIRQHAGPTDPRNGLFFLDYGLSQLRQLQTTSGVDDVLSPEKREETEKEMEACFINLDVARVCFQKQLDELEKQEHVHGNDAEEGDTSAPPAEETSSSLDFMLHDRVTIELTVAEVHNALAQLLMERGDYSGALREFDSELLIYRCLEEEEEEELPATTSKSKDDFVVPPGRMVACLYGAADCFLKEADFEGAEERLTATLDLIREQYPPPIIPKDLVEELEDWLADAKEMKGGKYLEVQQAIHQQFARDEMTEVLEQTSQHQAPPHSDSNAEESVGKDEEACQHHGARKKKKTTPAVAPPVAHNPFISALPLTDGVSSSSVWTLPGPLPHSRSGAPPPHSALLGLNEHSQSSSLFPPQSHLLNGAGLGKSSTLSVSEFSNPSTSNSSVVHSAVVAKNPKVPSCSSSQSPSHPPPPPHVDGGDKKRRRME